MTLVAYTTQATFFALGGYIIPIAKGSASQDQEDVGDDGSRAFSGTLHRTFVNKVSKWKAKTIPLTASDANQFQGILEATTQPVTGAGRMILSASSGTPLLTTRMTGRDFIQRDGNYYVIEFEVEESS